LVRGTGQDGWQVRFGASRAQAALKGVSSGKPARIIGADATDVASF
jgi:hypothetical protein